MPIQAAFGRYWPAESPLHALDPRTKMVCALVMMGFLFLAGSFATLGACAIAIAALGFASTIPFQQIARTMAPLMLIVALTALMNLFFVPGGETLWAAGPLAITSQGVHQAAFLGARLTLLLAVASLLTLTTTPLDLASAFEHLTRPLARFGFPAREFALILSLALRFFPLFIEEWTTIKAAQDSRGAQAALGIRRGSLRRLTSLITPLFASAFRHADALSEGMDSRCYRSPHPATRLRPLRIRSLDLLAFALVALGGAALLIARLFGL